MKIGNFIKKNEDFSKPYPAIVVDNNDPQKRGGLKVWIQPLLGEETVWVYPKLVNGTINIIYIPGINDVVDVEFEEKDIATGKWSNSEPPITLPSIFTGDDYPNIYGIADTNGNFITINRKTNNISLNSTTVDITATTTTVHGDLHVTGKSTLDDTCTFENIGWISHKHPYTWTDGAGSGNTGGPTN